MTPSRLAEIRAAVEAAPESATKYNALSVANRRRLIDLYALARTALPELLDECERLRQMLAEAIALGRRASRSELIDFELSALAKEAGTDE